MDHECPLDAEVRQDGRDDVEQAEGVDPDELPLPHARRVEERTKDIEDSTVRDRFARGSDVPHRRVIDGGEEEGHPARREGIGRLSRTHVDVHFQSLHEIGRAA